MKKSLLIQGRFRPNCIAKYINRYYDFFDEIIISSYKHDYFNFLEDKKMKKLKIVYNDDVIDIDIDKNESYFNGQRIYFQAMTILNGLKQVTTEYTLKVRGDEFYSNLDKVDYNSNKFLTNNVLFSPNIKYHISDHLFGTNTNDLIKTIEKVIYNCVNKIYNCESNYIPETNIFEAHMDIINGDKTLDWKQIIEKYIDIIYIDDLEPFIITYNSINEVFQNVSEYYNSNEVKTNKERGMLTKPILNTK